MTCTSYEAWSDLCRRIRWQGPKQTVYDYIVFAYGAPVRYYHTLSGHIEFCLKEFKEAQLEGLAKDPAGLEMAIWLHDIVHFLTDRDEYESLAFADLLLRQGNVGKETRRTVTACIFATRHTSFEDLSNDAKLMVDIDLASLGQPRTVFDREGELIREEYRSIPETEFSKGRSRILESFLKRNPLYQTPYFREKYERQARENLLRSIAALAL